MTFFCFHFEMHINTSAITLKEKTNTNTNTNKTLDTYQSLKTRKFPIIETNTLKIKVQLSKIG